MVWIKIMGKFRLFCEGIIDPTPITSNVISKIDYLKPQLINKNLDSIEAARILNYVLEDKGLKFEESNREGVQENSDYTQIGVHYAAANEDGSISVFIKPEHFHENFESEKDFIYFLKILKTILNHEVIHSLQLLKIFDAKNQDAYRYSQVIEKLVSKNDDGAEYLGNIAEVMAFAKEAIDQFRTAGYAEEEILERIKNPRNKEIYPSINESTIFQNYIDYFNSGDPVFKKFIYYMARYLRG